MIRFLLNGTQCQDGPEGVNELEEELLLSDEQHGYVYQIQGALTFIGKDYDTLRALYDVEYCQDVQIEIQYSGTGGIWETKVNGLIKLADANWDLIRRQVECQIVDNSYLAKINNNRNIKFRLGNNKYNGGPVLSKNGVDVTYKAIYHQNVLMFSPLYKRTFNSEAFFDLENAKIDMRPAGRIGIFIYDALNLIIAMMSDDGVDFESTYFSYNLSSPASFNAEAFGVLIAGANLRTGNFFPYISFQDFFDDLHKIFNVYFALEKSSNGKPVLRVEHESYFKQQGSDMFFDKIKSMVESIDIKNIYSKITLGCSRQDASFPMEDIPLILHTQEEYGLTGNCNLDNTLDLRLSALVINTNSICLSLPPIVGFNKGASVIKKYTTGITTAGIAGQNQVIVDTGADFEVKGVKRGYIIQNTVDLTWTYITRVESNSKIWIWDNIFVVDNPSTGIPKNYNIYEPAVFDDADEDVFLIQIDQFSAQPSVIVAKGTDIPASGAWWYYNENYANYKVIERHLGGLAQSIIDQISDGNDQFEAGVVAANINAGGMTLLNDELYRAIPFDDDFTGPTFFDTNGNYDPNTGFYIVPQAGYYFAYCEVNVQNANNVDGGITLRYELQLSQLSAAGDIITAETAASLITLAGNTTFTLFRLFACEPGDRICVAIKRPFNEGISGTYPLQYIPWPTISTPVGGAIIRTSPPAGATSIFKIDGVFNGGGILLASEPDEVRLLSIESEMSLSRNEFDGVLLAPFKYYTMHYGNNKYVSGYIDKINRGILSGETIITSSKKKNGI